MKRIILTGGGTAGHVTPNIALIPKLRELGYDIQYIGSYNGIEKELIEPFEFHIMEFLLKAAPLFQSAEFHRSIPCDQRLW